MRTNRHTSPERRILRRHICDVMEVDARIRGRLAEKDNPKEMTRAMELKENVCIQQEVNEHFAIYHGDCCEVIRQIPDNSIDLSVYSPPFSSLYIYSESERDMGNSASDAEFFEHYKFLIREKLRVTRPGRLSCVHCKQIVNYKGRDGASGWRDFRGDVIRAHQEAGWVYHSEVVIWKCPVHEMTKTKTQRLLYKQLRKDSTYSGVGIPEYVIFFRKWPKNEAEELAQVPVTHTKEGFSLPQWQEWASPVWTVWFDINQTNVLNASCGRGPNDEKHICPMPLDAIERCIEMWSNPGDVVLSPFGGIGSEGYQAVKMGRKAVLIELKESYYRQAVKFCGSALASSTDIFSGVEIE